MPEQRPDIIPATPPPANLEAEQSVLGAMLIETDAIVRASAILTGADFYRDAHRQIYETVLAMRERGEAVDLITLADALRAVGALDDVGGIAYLTMLANAVPTAANVEHYARIVRDKAIRRRAIEEAHRLMARAMDEDEPADRLASDTAGRLMTLATQATADAHLRDIGTIASARIDQYEEARLRKGMIGWPTGIPTLDRYTGGLHPGEVTILAARPSVGKTALAMQIAVYGARLKRQAVLFASQEMPGEALVDRLIGAAAGIQPYELRSGRIERDDQWIAISRAVSELAMLPIIVDDGRLTTEAIWSAARRIQLERPLGLIVVDYLQLLSDQGRDSEVQRVSMMSHRLKAMARDLNVPVLCLSQLNRLNERESRPPRLSDLRESGAIEQDADVVLMLHVSAEDSRTDPRPTTLIVAKQRMGPIGDIALQFRRSMVRFEEIDAAHEPPTREPVRRNGDDR